MSKTGTFSDNKLVISLDGVGRTAEQKRRLIEYAKSMDLQALIGYIETFKGKRNKDLKYVHNFQKPSKKVTDKLATKEPGSVLRKFLSMSCLDRSHAPISDKTDWVGIEIECVIPNDSIDASVCPRCDGAQTYFDEDRDEDVDCPRCEGTGTTGTDAISAVREIFKAKNTTLSSVKRDGSIEAGPGFSGIEITVLTRLSNPSHLKRVCEILKELGAKVNKSCGLHVHLDSRHLSSDEVKVIGRRFSKALPALLGLVPRSRRNNTFCKPSVSKLTGGRYFAVNLTAFQKYETVEVRLHSATTDFEKIIHWLKLCSAIAGSTELSSPRTPVAANINDLEGALRISESTLEYFSNREILFGESVSPSVSLSSQDQDSDSEQTQLEIGA